RDPQLYGMKLKELLIITGVLLAILIGLAWYAATHMMVQVTERVLDPGGASAEVLIATQGSAYKGAVTRELSKGLAKGGVRVTINDVSSLGQVDPDQWDAIVVMHTWEYWRPEPNAKAFREEHGNARHIIYLSTSGSGEERLDVDAVSSASTLTDTLQDARAILARVEELVARSTGATQP
ncbi:MAG: hypothetical protein KDB88_09645, partial [Flavobacteriales bacterium]|nr:hypothetical protein [Flavobacteriales bacterium]